jgi:hypothetical protein
MIAMAEAILRGRNVPEERWRGSHFRFAQNVEGGPWASVLLELERRGDEWLVTRIERYAEPLPEEQTGFSILRAPEEGS